MEASVSQISGAFRCNLYQILNQCSESSSVYLTSRMVFGFCMCKYHLPFLIAVTIRFQRVSLLIHLKFIFILSN